MLLEALQLGIAAVALAAALVLVYGLNLQQRFRLRHIPGPKPKLFVGNLKDHLPNRLHDQLAVWPRQYGRVMKIWLGRIPYVVITDPELVKMVATTKFSTFHDRPGFPAAFTVSEEDKERRKWEILWAKGKFWGAVRAACEPLFHSTSLHSYGPTMHSCISKLMEVLESASAGPVDVTDPLQNMSLDVVGTAAFGVDFDCQGKEPGPIAAASKFIMKPQPILVRFRQLLMVFPDFKPLFEFWAKTVGMATPALCNYVRASGFLMGTSKQLLHNSCASTSNNSPANGLKRPLVSFPGKETDMKPGLRAFIEGQAAGCAQHADKIPSPNSFFYKLKDASHREIGQDAKPLTDIQIHSQAPIFVLAGYDTTSLGLSYTLYELARDAGMQGMQATKQVTAEVDAFFKEHDRLPQRDDLSSFPYIQAAFQEGLRMHNPVSPIFVTIRQAAKDVNLGGYKIPKGTRVVLNTIGMAADENLFPDPEKFRPERHISGSEDGPDTRSPYAHSPFGCGPHKCIGYRFAVEEAVFTLVRLYQKWIFTLSAENHPAGSQLHFRFGVTLAPEEGVHLNLHSRT